MQGGIFLWKKKGIKYGKNRETKGKKDNLILTNGTVLFCYSQSSRMEEKCMSSTALGAEKAIIFISDDTRRNIKSILDSQHRAEGTGKADDD